MPPKFVPERLPRQALLRWLALAGLLLTLLAPQTAHAAALHLDGRELGLLWVVPFVGLLLSIAIFPLVAPVFWHNHFGKISAAWALTFVLPFLGTYGISLTVYELLHTVLLEYIPFIILLFSLFTITSGIYVEGALRGTPGFNTAMLGLGAFLASWMGTTGAAMVLIRPVLRANAWRPSRSHIVIFFIFLVANIGGSLTPLGDPPLFLGFLKGVPFFWPTVHMFLPWLFCCSVLLIIFYLLDRYMLARDGVPVPERQESRLRIHGAYNLILLAGVVGSVLLSGVWRPGVTFVIYHVEVELQSIVRNLLLLTLAGISWVLTPLETREANDFSWFPMQEVAKLFAGIFITIIPAIAILRAGEAGALAPIIAAVTLPDGSPNNVVYFWATGLLSSFLDNAPTYLVFFNTAGGDPVVLTGPLQTTLLAISAGAVFMGANTYIGNAPNFMVRAIAEQQGTPMPSFFGYMLWSTIFLMPLYVLVTLIWFW